MAELTNDERCLILRVQKHGGFDRIMKMFSNR